MRRLLVLLGVLPTLACYSYVTASPEVVPAGTRVSASLTTRGSAENEVRLGADATRIEGRLIRRTNDSLELAVERIRSRSGTVYRWNGEPLSIDQDFVASFRERKFSRTKTALVAIGVAALAYVATSTDLVGFARDNDPSNPEGPPPVGGS